MADEAPRRRRRTTPRVEDSGKTAGASTKPAQHRGSTEPEDAQVTKMQMPAGSFWEITCQASELVPVAQYANVTIGPVAVKRRVPDTGNLQDLKAAITEVQQVIYDVIAEDREAVEESVRLHNQREAEEQAKQARRR